MPDFQDTVSKTTQNDINIRYFIFYPPLFAIKYFYLY